MKNYNKDYPPIDCDCGCEESVKVNPDLMIAIKKESNIGNKEAKRYNKLLNNELREKLLKKWHDYIVFVNSKK